ncbi:hypothetical protein EW145_g5719 [Phellinidium pouzarii]|uniref:Uncharacterized protein n=1 Tax=Phellinidium pouzarii TaxID=167371 RepID=A0A4S4KZM0_9AGAM|nr:hypothetical protein EW145_g5719 [Phellinidium pouzarii]
MLPISPRSSIHTQRFSSVGTFASSPGQHPATPHPIQFPVPAIGDDQFNPYHDRDSLRRDDPYRDQDALSQGNPTYIDQNAFEHSYVDVDENMDIGREDEEFARRAPAPRRGPFRILRQFFRALAFPFKIQRFLPKFMRRRRPTSALDIEFRDPTPVPPSIRLTYSQERGNGEHDHVQQDLLVPPPPSTAPVTMIEVGTVNGRDDGNDLGRSASLRSHLSRQSQSHKGSVAHGATEETTAVPNTTSPVNTHHSTRTSLAHGFPPQPPPSLRKTPTRSSRTHSISTTSSHDSSLLYHITRLYHAICALYRLPWVATQRRRVTVDFVPAYSSARSKYRVRPDLTNAVPPADRAALRAIADLPESESWYHPSIQQIRKRRERRERRHRHSYQSDHYQQFPTHHRQPTGGSTHANASPGSAAGIHGLNNSPSAFAFSYGSHPLYMFPTPQHYNTAGVTNAPEVGTGGIGSSRPARPPSVVSVTTARPRHQPRSSQSLGHNTTSSAGSGRDRGDMPRSPPPIAQPMYIMPTFAPGLPPLPPSYAHVFPYQYPPAWMPTPSPPQQQHQ